MKEKQEEIEKKAEKQKENKSKKEREEKNTIICIVAHSDDQIFGPGGTLAKAAKEGKRVITYILSYGELSHPHFKKETIKEIRIKESMAADKIIGGSGVEFFGLKEGKFLQEAEEKQVIKEIAERIKKENPERIYTHATDDPHPDHKATSEIVKKAYDKAGIKCPVYTFDVWTIFNKHKRNSPKLVVDISDTFKIKIRALKQFKSQLGVWGFLINIYYVYAGMLARNFFSGLKYGYKFAEVFYKLR